MAGRVSGRQRLTAFVVAAGSVLALFGCSGGPAHRTASGTPGVSGFSASAAGPVVGRARIVSTRHVSGRVWGLVVASPAVGRTGPVRLPLPARFTAQPERRWPALYLLHGCCD